MTEQEALYRGILADPDDDAPRLVYADWLDENGEAERAEYIRVEVERARLDPWDARQVDLRFRSRELWRHTWENHAPTVEHCSIGWDRGFPSTIGVGEEADFASATRDAFRQMPIHSVRIGLRPDFVDVFHSLPGRDRITELSLYADHDDIPRPIWVAAIHRLVALGPWPAVRRLSLDYRFITAEDIRIALAEGVFPALRSFAIEQMPSDLEIGKVLAALPASEQFRELRFRGGIGDADAGAIAASSAFQSLATLRLSATKIGADGFARLCRSPFLANIAELDLTNTRIGLGLLELPTASFGRSLRSLRLTGCSLPDDSVAEWLRAGLPPGLHSLDLSRNGLSDEAIANWPTDGPGLSHLNLFMNLFGSAGSLALARSRTLLDVRSLDVCENNFRPDLPHLLASPTLRQLRELRLDGPTEGVESARAFASAPWPELRCLSVGRGSVTAEVAVELACADFPYLRTLELQRVNLGAEALTALLAAPFIRNVRCLDISGNRVTDAMIALLAASPNLEELRTLVIRDQRFTAESLEPLLESPHLAGVREFRFSRNYCDDEAKSRLRAKFGDRITFR